MLIKAFENIFKLNLYRQTNLSLWCSDGYWDLSELEGASRGAGLKGEGGAGNCEEIGLRFPGHCGANLYWWNLDSNSVRITNKLEVFS